MAALDSVLRISVVTLSKSSTWDVTWVNLPGAKGRRGLFPETAPEILMLQDGMISFQRVGSSASEELAISSGIAHIYTSLDGHTCCDIMTDEISLSRA